jgi:hypothetical protein
LLCSFGIAFSFFWREQGVMEGVMTLLAYQQQVFWTFAALRAVVEMMRDNRADAAASFAPIIRPLADGFINLLGYLGRMFELGCKGLYWCVSEPCGHDMKRKVSGRVRLSMRRSVNAQKSTFVRPDVESQHNLFETQFISLGERRPSICRKLHYLRQPLVDGVGFLFKSLHLLVVDRHFSRLPRQAFGFEPKGTLFYHRKPVPFVRFGK